MEKTITQKLKLLELINILKEFSDRDHPLCAAELIEKMKEHGISIERKAIYSSIEALKQYGLDIRLTYRPKQGFYMESRMLSLPEARILMDAVSSAPFITPKKTKELIEKLKGTLSVYQAETIEKQVFVEERVKFENEEIYRTIQTLNAAISGNQKVRFFYQHRVIKGSKAVWGEKKQFVLSPYALIWSNDKYYVAGNYDKYDNVSNYRLDRIHNAELLKEPARPFYEVSEYAEVFDAADYGNKNIDMYTGEPEMVELLCKNSFLESFFDKFGTQVTLKVAGEDYFAAKLVLYVSDGLVEWLLQHGDRVWAQAPQTLRNRVKDRAKALYEAYWNEK